MKTGIIPLSELNPGKSLLAKDYLDTDPGSRTMGLKLSGSTHEQLDQMKKRHGFKSKKAVAFRALEIGLRKLDSMPPGRGCQD